MGSAESAPDTEPAWMIDLRVAGGGFGVFVALGALQAIYGPLIPALRSSFHLHSAGAGLVISAHFAGAATGILCSIALARRLSVRGQLSAGTGCVAGGCLILAAAPIWAIVLAAAFFIGLGYGSLVVGYNTMFARGFGRRSAAMLNLLNAAFGAGAIAGPVVVGMTSINRFRPPYIAGALLIALLFPLVWAAPARLLPAARSTGASGRRSFGLLAVFVALFFLYEGIETGVSSWEATLLVFHGFSRSSAASVTALFWAAVTVGRLLAAPLALRVPPPRMVMGAFLLVSALAVVAHFQGLAPVAYILIGLALAPIFPTGLVWLSRALPAEAGGTSLAILGALIGGVLFPPMVGQLINARTPDILPTVLFGIAVSAVLLTVGLDRHTGRNVSEVAAAGV